MKTFCKYSLSGGGNFNPTNTLIKGFLSLLFITATLTACNDADETIPTQASNKLNITVQTAKINSRGIIESSTLPDASTIGISLMDASGTTYNNINYNNIKVTASTGVSPQIWTLADDVVLSSTKGTVYGYFPYSTTVTDLAAIPVETKSQTNYMYATPVKVASNNPNASMVFNHMMANFCLSLVRGTYEGTGIVTEISIQSDGIAADGTFNVVQTTPAYTAFNNIGTSISRSVNTTLGGEAINMMVIPTGSVAPITFCVTVDDEVYTVTTTDIEPQIGHTYKYSLTLDKILSLANVTYEGDITGIQANYVHNNDNTITVTVIADDENTFVDDAVLATNASVSTAYDNDDNLIITLSDITDDVTLTMAGTRPRVMNFDYTGNVQDITLPKGTYKLQCWGAQGGTSYGSANGIGSKGGYAEGQLTLTENMTLYAFVGGQGANGSSTALVNGGWNGGGGSVGYSSYNNSGLNGWSYPASGGGATDISTVSSDMSYLNGRNNRSYESLLSRCIVAGGGAGGSFRYTSQAITVTNNVNVVTFGSVLFILGDEYTFAEDVPITAGITYYTTGSQYTVWLRFKDSSSNVINTGQGANGVTAGPGAVYMDAYILRTGSYIEAGGISVYYISTSPSTSESSSFSNQSQQGGGAYGIGNYPGTPNAAGVDGDFGFGANQVKTNFRYCAGGGGGGWYGGGTGYNDNTTDYINYTGGGSGFVNTDGNTQYRPNGYTGLKLDSGTTIAGNTSFPSINGSTETGHSGNGYARITRLK